MDKNAQLADAFKKLIGANPSLPVPGVVIEVTGDHCSVIIDSGLVLTDVKLKATINDNANYVLFTPKVGSAVLMISLTGKLDNMAVIKVDEIAKFEYSQNGLILSANSDDGKLSVRNDNVSLTEIFTSLGTLLRQLKFFTNSGVSGLPIPASITAIEEFENKFKQLLNDD